MLLILRINTSDPLCPASDGGGKDWEGAALDKNEGSKVQDKDIDPVPEDEDGRERNVSGEDKFYKRGRIKVMARASQIGYRECKVRREAVKSIEVVAKVKMRRYRMPSAESVISDRRESDSLEARIAN